MGFLRDGKTIILAILFASSVSLAPGIPAQARAGWSGGPAHSPATAPSAASPLTATWAQADASLAPKHSGDGLGAASQAEARAQKRARLEVNAADGDLGDTMVAAHPDGSVDYYVNGAADFGTCYYATHGAIQMQVDISRFYGAVDPDGHPAPGNVLFGSDVRVVFQAFDVDEFGPGDPEVDTVTVNGIAVPRQSLTGNNQTSAPAEIDVPAADLLLERDIDDTSHGLNLIQVNVDTLNTGNWCVEIDGVTLTTPVPDAAGMPVVLIYGMGENTGDLDTMYRQLPAMPGALQKDLPSPIAEYEPTPDNQGGINKHVKQTFPDIVRWVVKIADRTPYRKVNIVGHSFGGFDARVFASQYPFVVNKIVMLGTPNGGVDPGPAGILCNFKLLCDLKVTPEGYDTIRQNVEAMNSKYPDRASVTYLASVGTVNDHRCDGIPLERGSHFDGCINAESGLYLVKTLWYPELQTGPGPGALEQYAAQYPIGHEALLSDGRSVRDVWCFLYDDHDATCPSNGAQATWLQSSPASTSPMTSAHGSAGAVSANHDPGGVWEDAIDYLDVSVPAGGSISVPLAFGGAGNADIMLLQPGADIAASFAGSALARGNNPMVGTLLSASIAQPVDGVLTVTNSGGSDEAATLVLGAPTSRHLTVDVGSQAQVGGSVDVSIVLSDALPDEAVVARLYQADGSSADVALTPSGAGAWRGVISPTQPGQARLAAWVTSASPRYSVQSVDVASGQSSLDLQSDGTTDSNSNGLADSLDVDVTVSVRAPDQYLLMAQLEDSDGNELDGSSATTSLTAGSTSVPVHFDGFDLYRSQKSGPYTVRATLIDLTTGGVTEAGPDVIGHTQARDYHTFEHDPITLDTASWTATGVDADNNGTFEMLRASGNVHVDQGGDYTVHANVAGPSGTIATTASEQVTLVAGTQQVSLTFRAAAIYGSNVEGPYEVEDLSLVSSDGLTIGLGQGQIATPYTRSQFQDTTKPTSAITVLPPKVGGPALTLSVTSADPESGVDHVAVWERYSANGGGFSPWAQVGTTTSGSFSTQLTAGNATYQFYSIATDKEGNQEDPPAVADASIVLDPSSLPSSRMEALPQFVSTSTPVVSIDTIDHGSGVGYAWISSRCLPVGSTTWSSWSSDWMGSAPPYYAHLSCGDGQYQFRSMASDWAGNLEPVHSAADAATTLDTGVPTSNVSTMPATVASTNVLVPFSASDSAGSGLASVQLWRRFTPTNGSTGDWSQVATTTSTPFTVGLFSGNGTYDFYTVAIDNAGNVEDPPKQWSLFGPVVVPDVSVVLAAGGSVDTTPPSSAVGSVPASTSSSALTVPFTASDDTGGYGVASVELWKRFQASGSGDWTPWTYVQSSVSSPFNITLGQGDGRYEFYSLAVDVAGNREPTTGVADAFTVLQMPPPATSIDPLPTMTNSGTVSLSYSVGPGAPAQTVQIWSRFQPSGSTTWSDWSQAATAISSPVSVTMASGEGTYEFYSIGVGSQGDQEAAPASADASILLDTVAPTSTIASVGYSGSPPVASATVESSDAGSGIAQIRIYYQFEPAGGSAFGPWTPLLATLTCFGANTDCLLSNLALPDGDGTYNYTSVVVDAAGNSETGPAVVKNSMVLDTVAPTSVAGPLPTAVRTVSISIPYTAADPNGSGVAGVDLYRRFQAAGSSTWTDWTYVTHATSSPISTYLASGDGRYEFLTQAQDLAGNLEQVWPYTADTWTVLDRTAPVTSAGPMPSLINNPAQSIPYIVSDANGSGVASMALQRRFKAAGSGSFGSWSTIATVTNPDPSGTIPVTLGSSGTYEFRTIGTDAVGNVEGTPSTADASTVLDSVAPVTSASALPANTTASTVSLSYAATDTNGSGVASVELWERYTTPGGTPSGPYTLIANPTSSPVSVALSYGDGRYEFYTVGTDVAGNRELVPGSADAYTVRDTSIPSTQAGPLAPAVNSTTLSVPYTITGGTASSIQLVQRWTTPGGTPSGAYTLVSTINSPAASGSFAVTLSKGAGRYEFYTIGVSAGGSSEAAPASADAFTILDTTTPTSAAASLTTPRTGTSVSLSYTASDNTNGSGLASVELWQRYTVPGGTPSGSYTKIATATSSPVSVTLSAGDGRYEFYTIAVDAAGNREAAPSSADAYTVLDTTGPVTSASALAAGVKSTTLSVPFAATDAGGNGVASVELWQRYTVPGGTPSGSYTKVTSGTTSPFSVTLGSGAGRYEFYTIGVDSLGNRETVPASPDAFTVLDTTAPTSAAGALPALVNATSLSVPYTGSDNTNGSGLSKVDLYQRYQTAGSTSWSTWAKVGNPGTTGSGTIAITLSSGNGTYQFYTIATDNAGNAEAAPSAADASTVLDATAPTSTITAPTSTSSATSISISYTASDNTNGSGLASVEFWYRYRASDGATAGAWTSGGSSTAASGSFTLTFGSGAGIYDVLTVAVDRAGNREGGIANPPASGATPKSLVRSTSWGTAAKVNTDTGTALQDNAAYVVGSDGTVYAVWEDGRNGNTDIYFSSRNPSTGVWATETKLNSDTGSAGQRTPSIAIDGSGNLYVVWADDRNGSTNTDIYFAKRTGTTWSANIKVNADTATAIQSQPRIAVSSAGIAVAVWYDARSSQVNIYSARLPAGSTTWSTNYNITTSNTSAVKAAPDVAVASDGTAWATWQDNRTGGGDIYTASLGPSATAWSTNTKVSDDSGSSSVDKSPRIGLTSAGLPVVAYLDGRSTNAAVRVTNRTSGGTWNATVQVSDASAKPSGGLALAVKADGGAIVAWDDTRSTSAIWGAQCEAGSGTSSVTRCGPAEKWSDQTGASYRPTIFATATQVYLGWRDDTAGNGDIRIRLRTPS